MLQFNKSLPTNKNAVYLETVDTGSTYYDDLVVVYSQSFDESSGKFPITATSIPNAYRNYLIIENTGSVVPSPSGQYDIGIWTNEFTAAVWNQVAVAWDSYDEVWDTAGQDLPTDLLYSDRAYISGSNESSLTSYISSNENGKYITYNG